MNIDKLQAVKFIFISSIPAILGATFLELKEVAEGTVMFQPSYIYGMITAFIFAIFFNGPDVERLLSTSQNRWKLRHAVNHW